MAAPVRSRSKVAGASSLSIDISDWDVQPGDLLHVEISGFSNVAVAIATPTDDTGSNTWNLNGQAPWAAGFRSVPGSAYTIVAVKPSTLNLSAGPSAGAIAAVVYLVKGPITSVVASAVVDQKSGNTQASATPSNSAITTGYPEEIAFACLAHDGSNLSLGSLTGWTVWERNEDNANQAFISAFQTFVAATTVTHQWQLGGSLNAGMMVTSYKLGKTVGPVGIPGDTPGFQDSAFQDGGWDTTGDAFQQIASDRIGHPTVSQSTPVAGVSGVGAIPSGAAFGTTKLLRQVREDGTGIATQAAVGQPALRRQLGATGISTGVAFGVTRINRQVGPNGIASNAAVGQPTLNRVFAQGISTGAAVGQPAVQRRLGTTGVSTGAALGQPKLFIQVGPAGIASAQGVGQPRAFLQLGPAGIQTAIAFGTTKTQRQVREDGTGIASAAALGVPTVGVQTTQPGPGNIPTGEAFGTTQVKRQVREDGTGISTRVAFGTAAIGHTIGPGGIASGAQVGTPAAQRQVREDGAGIPSAAAFGQPSIQHQIGPGGIASGAAFGTASVRRQVGPGGIASAAAVGTPRIIRVVVQGIPSGEALGVPRVGNPLAVSVVGDVTVSDRATYTVGLSDGSRAAVGLSDTLTRTQTAVDVGRIEIRLSDRAAQIALSDLPGG